MGAILPSRLAAPVAVPKTPMRFSSSKTAVPSFRPVVPHDRKERRFEVVAMAFRGGRGGGSRGGGRRPNRGPPKRQNERRDVLMNDEIDASEVRVVGEDKEALGIMGIGEALNLADEQGVDLLLVVPDASPPVCRLIEYSKFKYEKTKAEKDAKKKQRESVIETKELKMRPGTDVHDYQVKVRAAQKFIDKGFRVKLTLQFRGREMEFKEIGRQMFERFVEDLGGNSVVNVESEARMQGRQMLMVISKKEGAPSVAPGNELAKGGSEIEDDKVAVEEVAVEEVAAQ